MPDASILEACQNDEIKDDSITNQNGTRSIKVICGIRSSKWDVVYFDNLPNDITAAEMSQLIINNAEIPPPIRIFEDDLLLRPNDFIHENEVVLIKNFWGFNRLFVIFCLFHLLIPIYAYLRSIHEAILIYSILSLIWAFIWKKKSKLLLSTVKLTTNRFYVLFRFILVFFTSFWDFPSWDQNFDFVL